MAQAEEEKGCTMEILLEMSQGLNVKGLMIALEKGTGKRSTAEELQSQGQEGKESWTDLGNNVVWLD